MSGAEDELFRIRAAEREPRCSPSRPSPSLCIIDIQYVSREGNATTMMMMGNTSITIHSNT